jgi:hypothetical protein
MSCSCCFFFFAGCMYDFIHPFHVFSLLPPFTPPPEITEHPVLPLRGFSDMLLRLLLSLFPASR